MANQSPIPFQPQWPFQFGGLDVLRSIASPMDSSDEIEAGMRMWISHARIGPEVPAALISELTATNARQSHFFGVTLASQIVFQDQDRAHEYDSEEKWNAFLGVWGEWLAHLHWDFGVTVMRTMAAGMLGGCDLDVPAVTPRPVLGFPDGEDKEGRPAHPSG